MIRDYKPEDQKRIEEIHAAQGFDYKAPDLSEPLFLVRKVRDIDGKVVAAMALRLVAETYLFVDGSTYERARAIEELQPEVIREAYDKGLSDVVCVIPPEIEESFTGVLQRMGWARDRDWPMYSRSTNA